MRPTDRRLRERLRAADAADLERVRRRRRGEERDLTPRERFRQQVRWLLVGGAVIVALAFVAGYFVSTLSGTRAARRVLAERVEPVDTPTSSSAEPVCGLVDGPAPEEVRAAVLASGGVVVAFDPDTVGRSAVAEVVGRYRSHLLATPDPTLDAAVVATAPGTRLVLAADELDLVTAFAAGFGDPRTPPEDCPVPGTG